MKNKNFDKGKSFIMTIIFSQMLLRNGYFGVRSLYHIANILHVATEPFCRNILEFYSEQED